MNNDQNDNNENNRVLGRALAVEEIKNVSGAKVWHTTYQADTFFLFDNPQP